MKLRLKAFLFCCALVGANPSSFAQSSDEDGPRVLVQAERIQDTDIESARTVTIVDEPAIRARKAATVADLLRTIPGIDVYRQGPVGHTTSVFIRGARSEDTLVMIDGAEVNDALSPAGGFDFSLMSTALVERIEIFRGPQSIRFGSGALGGVINIVTKEGKGPLATSYFLESGSYDTQRGALGFSAKANENLSYSLGYEGYKSSGFSAAGEQYGNKEPDGAQIDTVSGKVVVGLGSNLKWETASRYSVGQIELDDGSGAGKDDSNYTGKTSQVSAVTSVRGKFDVGGKVLDSRVAYAFAEINRGLEDLPEGATALSRSVYLGENQKVETNHELWLSEPLKARLDLQWKSETGGSSATFGTFKRESQETTGEALSLLYDDQSFFGDVGARQDQNTREKEISTYRVSAGLKAKQYRGKAYLTHGTGFKLPSIYQLYDAFSGLWTLKYEKSQTTELTLQAGLTEKDLHSISFFESYFVDMIDYNDTTSKYENVGKARSRGFEVESEVEWMPSTYLNLSYTYLDAVNDTTGARLVRRPLNAYTVKLRKQVGLVQGYIQYRNKGSRDDVVPGTFPNQIRSVWEYGVTDAGVEVGFKEFKVHARVDNLFDYQYEEVLGYGSSRAAYYAGVSGEF